MNAGLHFSEISKEQFDIIFTVAHLTLRHFLRRYAGLNMRGMG